MIVTKSKHNTQNNILLQQSSLFALDIWKAEELGAQPNLVHSIYHLNFKGFNPEWFKQVMKQFIHYQSATKSFTTCQSYICKLKLFSRFIEDYDKCISPNDINRALILKYIAYLSSSKMAVGSRNLCLIHLRTLHSIVLREKWLPWPNEPLIYPGDIVQEQKNIPKFIPEYVVSQLQKELHHLPTYLQNMVIIFLETGRRVSEVCSMSFDCLSVDPQGEPFLIVEDKKLKKSYLIPVSEKCITAIRNQQHIAKQKIAGSPFLFPARIKRKSPHISGRWINIALNKLAQKCKIVDEYGKIWKFHSHQFRHTVGTRMINANVPQAIVQKYLGHESAEMTSRYAHIYNETLKKAFDEYQGKLVNIRGEAINACKVKKINDAKWFKYNIMSQALPNGICSLPAPQQSCPHANACLTCIHFNTHKEFLPQHKKQLETTNKIITQAKENGWDRLCEMNLQVKNNLENIIQSIDGE